MRVLKEHTPKSQTNITKPYKLLEEHTTKSQTNTTNQTNQSSFFGYMKEEKKKEKRNRRKKAKKNNYVLIKDTPIESASKANDRHDSG